ncbi:MAG: plastocyanin/azurin family copper-binding protein [Actinomycetota bacterium]
MGRLHISAHVEPGSSLSATFMLEEAGTYTFYCSVPGHREAGMEGELTVTEG